MMIPSKTPVNTYWCVLPFSGSNNQEASVDMGIVLLICMKPAGKGWLSTLEVGLELEKLSPEDLGCVFGPMPTD